MKGRKTNFSDTLVDYGIPALLIPGMLFAAIIGAHNTPGTFPQQAKVMNTLDGDTFTISTGQDIRLLGINAPDRGQPGYEEAKYELETLTKNKTIFLEFDRYQQDKYGRLLAWVWIDCEDTPVFEPFDYMHDTRNHSKPGLEQNPENCKQGKLINEQLVQDKKAVVLLYKNRGSLKYEHRLTTP